MCTHSYYLWQRTVSGDDDDDDEDDNNEEDDDVRMPRHRT
jgi:hypothetical protein